MTKEQIKNQLEVLIDKIYDYNDVGSNCHVVLDDDNLEDESITSTLDKYIPDNIHNCTSEQLDIEKACMHLLLLLTYKERVEFMEDHYGTVIDD